MKTFTRKRVAQRGSKLLPHTSEWTIKVLCHDIEQIKENKPWTSSGYDFNVSSSPHTFPITYIFLLGLSSNDPWTTPEAVEPEAIQSTWYPPSRNTNRRWGMWQVTYKVLPLTTLTNFSQCWDLSIPKNNSDISRSIYIKTIYVVN